MLKSIFGLLIFVFLIVLLVACGPIIPSVGAPQIRQTSSPIPTEQLFALTKFAVLTDEAETQTAVSPKNDATVTAIVATKFAGTTQMAKTITAMPTETPLPAIPNDSPFCTPDDLKTSYASNGATGNSLLGVVFTNISNTSCYLQAWPQAILVDEQGNPLDVDYTYQDMNTSESASASLEKVGLLPGWIARFDLLWSDNRTWCGSPITSNLIIRVALMNHSGTVEIPTDFQPGTACDVPGSRISVSITKIYLEPPPLSTPEQIKMFDENQGWMIGGEDYATSRIFHTDDGGLTWNDVTPSSTAYIGGGIFFLDSQTAWIPSATIGTDVPTIFHTTDAGKTWQQYQHLPFKQASLDFSNSMVGWATADEGVAAGNLYFTLYQTIDGGISWTQLMFAKNLGLSPEPSLPVGTFHVTDGQSFKFLNPSTIWFGGNQMVSMHNVRLQVSHDAGKTWMEKTIEVPEGDKIGDGLLTYAVPVFITAKDGYVVASYTPSDDTSGSTRWVSEVIMTHDGGNTWTASPHLIHDESDWSLHIDFISPTEAFFHCGDSLCVTHDGAQTWTSIPSNFSFAPIDDQQTLLDLNFVNARVGWTIVYENGVYQLIQTADGGATWAMHH